MISGLMAGRFQRTWERVKRRFAYVVSAASLFSTLSYAQPAVEGPAHSVPARQTQQRGAVGRFLREELEEVLSRLNECLRTGQVCFPLDKNPDVRRLIDLLRILEQRIGTPELFTGPLPQSSFDRFKRLLDRYMVARSYHVKRALERRMADEIAQNTLRGDDFYRQALKNLVEGFDRERLDFVVLWYLKHLLASENKHRNDYFAFMHRVINGSQAPPQWLNKKDWEKTQNLVQRLFSSPSSPLSLAQKLRLLRLLLFIHLDDCSLRARAGEVADKILNGRLPVGVNYGFDETVRAKLEVVSDPQVKAWLLGGYLALKEADARGLSTHPAYRFMERLWNEMVNAHSSQRTARFAHLPWVLTNALLAGSVGAKELLMDVLIASYFTQIYKREGVWVGNVSSSSIPANNGDNACFSPQRYQRNYERFLSEMVGKIAQALKGAKDVLSRSNIGEEEWGEYLTARFIPAQQLTLDLPLYSIYEVPFDPTQVERVADVDAKELGSDSHYGIAGPDLAVLRWLMLLVSDQKLPQSVKEDVVGRWCARSSDFAQCAARVLQQKVSCKEGFKDVPLPPSLITPLARALYYYSLMDSNLCASPSQGVGSAREGRAVQRGSGRVERRPLLFVPSNRQSNRSEVGNVYVLFMRSEGSVGLRDRNGAVEWFDIRDLGRGKQGVEFDGNTLQLSPSVNLTIENRSSPYIHEGDCPRPREIPRGFMCVMLRRENNE